MFEEVKVQFRPKQGRGLKAEPLLQMKIITILFCVLLCFVPTVGAKEQSGLVPPLVETQKDKNKKPLDVPLLNAEQSAHALPVVETQRDKNKKSLDVPWPLIVAVVSATVAFIFSLVQKRIDFQSLRKSTAIVLWVEILEAKIAAASLDISWDYLKVSANDSEPKPLLVISSDIPLLERVQIETLSYPPSVVSAITRFHNSIREFYQCLNTINSKSFRNTTSDRRQELIRMTIAISEKVGQRASDALDIMRKDLPSRWFKTLSGYISQTS